MAISPEIAAFAEGDLLRASAAEATTLGIFVQKRVVSGIIPGSYPSLALSKTLAVGDVIEAVDGKPVTDETFLTHIKNTRDAVGGKVKLLISSQGSRREVVLIRQLNSRLTATAKVANALAEISKVSTTPAAAEALSSLSAEVSRLLATITEDDAALSERLYTLQRKMASQKSSSAPGGAAAAALAPTNGNDIKALKSDLEVAALRASKAEASSREWEEAVDLMKRQLAAAKAEVDRAKAAPAPAPTAATPVPAAGSGEAEALKKQVDSLKSELQAVRQSSESGSHTAKKEVDSLKAEVARLKSELAGAAAAQQREVQLNARVQELSKKLDVSNTELASTKKELTAASAKANGHTNGASPSVSAEVEKERKKAALAKQLADSLAEKVKTLEAQLANKSAEAPAPPPSSTAAAPAAAVPAPATVPAPVAPAAAEPGAADASASGASKKKNKKKK